MKLMEKHIILYYMKTALISKDGYRRGNRAMTDWAEEFSQPLFGMDLSKYWRDECSEKYATDKTSAAEEEAMEKWNARPIKGRGVLKDLVEKIKIHSIWEKGFDCKTDLLLDAFKLSKPQKDLLRFLIYLRKYHTFANFMRDCFDIAFLRFKESEISMISGVPYSVVEDCFSEGSPLISLGLFNRREDRLSANFCKIINSNYSSKEDIKNIILSRKASAKLEREDFDYIGEEFTRCKKLLSGAVKKRERGINLMLYGPAGTGKSEFAKAVCSDLGVNYYMLSEEKTDTGKAARFSDLSIAQTLLSDDKNAVIIMDEAEDMFPLFRWGSNDADNPISKLFLNRMLENNKTPVIWISNNIRSMDPAFVRRFTYTLEIKKPDDKAKIKIWRNILKKNALDLSEDNIKELVKKHDIAPAYIDTAVRSARLIGNAGDIENTLRNLQKATMGYLPPPRKDEGKFSTTLLNTDTDLDVLTENILAKGIKRFSCCLYGAPGTGKSAYARYLADKMGLKVLHKRASNLFGSFVGETEQNIACAFNQAYEDGAMLVFDEADSFLRDRALAKHSWEISCVNEMLTWMESHPLPFVCTTNLMDGLDKASLRRFTFKVEYKYLNREQVARAFGHFFDVDLPPTSLKLDYLTPGDFAVVKNKADILGIGDTSHLVKLLNEEQELKGERAAPIGFMG